MCGLLIISGILVIDTKLQSGLGVGGQWVHMNPPPEENYEILRGMCAAVSISFLKYRKHTEWFWFLHFYDNKGVILLNGMILCGTHCSTEHSCLLKTYQSLISSPSLLVGHCEVFQICIYK